MTLLHPEIDIPDLPSRLFIGGQWRDSDSAGRFEVRDPASEEVIAEVANAVTADGDAALDAASDAGETWRRIPSRERAEVLRRAYELMLAQSDALASLMTLEMGKSLRESRTEVAYAAEFLRWFAGEAERIRGTVQTAPSGGRRIVTFEEPIGVSLLITPWNFPAAMITRKIGPALAAGCTAIVKPAPETPLTALALGKILHDSGCPPGVVNILPTNKSDQVVAGMLRDPRTRKLSFTGSTEVGRLLMERASEHVASISMELGGNAPFIVLGDADVESAVAGAMVAKLRNAGQSCVAANRFYVHESVIDEFVGKLAAAMDQQVVGPGISEGTDLGALVDGDARDRMIRLVASAQDRGARVLTGDRDLPSAGYFATASVIDHLAPNDPMIADEIFGPVAPIVSFCNDDEAIEYANDTTHGLAAYVFTRDLGKALRVAEGIETGMVGVNRGLVSDPAAPFGGVKESGLGREGGALGILEFIETKHVAVEW